MVLYEVKSVPIKETTFGKRQRSLNICISKGIIKVRHLKYRDDRDASRSKMLDKLGGDA